MCKDFDDREMDEIVKILGQEMLEYEKTVTEVNADALHRILDAYETMVLLYGKEQVRIHLMEPLRFSGSVSVNGGTLCNVDHTEEFAQILAQADTFEVYPKVDGTLEMVFGYDDVMIPKEEEE